MRRSRRHREDQVMDDPRLYNTPFNFMHNLSLPPVLFIFTLFSIHTDQHRLDIRIKLIQHRHQGVMFQKSSNRQIIGGKCPEWMYDMTKWQCVISVQVKYLWQLTTAARIKFCIIYSWHGWWCPLLPPALQMQAYLASDSHDSWRSWFGDPQWCSIYFIVISDFLCWWKMVCRFLLCFNSALASQYYFAGNIRCSADRHQEVLVTTFTSLFDTSSLRR